MKIESPKPYVGIPDYPIEPLVILPPYEVRYIDAIDKNTYTLRGDTTRRCTIGWQPFPLDGIVQGTIVFSVGFVHPKDADTYWRNLMIGRSLVYSRIRRGIVAQVSLAAIAPEIFKNSISVPVDWVKPEFIDASLRTYVLDHYRSLQRFLMLKEEGRAQELLKLGVQTIVPEIKTTFVLGTDTEDLEGISIAGWPSKPKRVKSSSLE